LSCCFPHPPIHPPAYPLTFTPLHTSPHHISRHQTTPPMQFLFQLMRTVYACYLLCASLSALSRFAFGFKSTPQSWGRGFVDGPCRPTPASNCSAHTEAAAVLYWRCCSWFTSESVPPCPQAPRWLADFIPTIPVVITHTTSHLGRGAYLPASSAHPTAAEVVPACRAGHPPCVLNSPFFPSARSVSMHATLPSTPLRRIPHRLSRHHRITHASPPAHSTAHWAAHH